MRAFVFGSALLCLAGLPAQAQLGGGFSGNVDSGLGARNQTPAQNDDRNAAAAFSGGGGRDLSRRGGSGMAGPIEQPPSPGYSGSGDLTGGQ